jgi:hypothetical protein
MVVKVVKEVIIMMASIGSLVFPVVKVAVIVVIKEVMVVMRVRMYYLRMV